MFSMKKKLGSSRPKKIKNNALTPLHGVAAACVIFFLFVGYSLVSREEKAEARSSLDVSEFFEIEVPSRAVAQGEKLREVPFSKLKWPSQTDASRFVKNFTAYSGYYAKVNLPAFSPIPIDSLSQSIVDTNAVVENIPLGYRAITVRVDVESVVEGWAQTGNYVDVIVLKQSTDPDMGVEAKLIAENVKILSSGASVEGTKNKYAASSPPATVTLLVSQEDALKIRTAATVGKLTFALRGVGDQSPSTTLSMNQKLLLGGAKSVQGQKTEKRGVAKGPDGKTYVLDGNAEWVRELSTE